MKLTLKLTLKSDATFGRGDGTAGLVDSETEYEETTGLPRIKGRTLRGLLVEECANVLEAIRLQRGGTLPNSLEKAAQKLFGQPGSQEADAGLLHVGEARFPDSLREITIKDIQSKAVTVEEIREVTTAIRRQTAMDERTGVPKRNSLRSERVVLRETVLVAELETPQDLSEMELALLAASVRSLRRGGIGRNRGRGRLACELKDAAGQDVAVDALFSIEEVTV